MKGKYQDAIIVFGIIFSILAVILYLVSIAIAQMSVFAAGIIFQVIGAVLIGIYKKDIKKTKEQDAQDLARLTAANNKFDEDKKLV